MGVSVVFWATDSSSFFFQNEGFRRCSLRHGCCRFWHPACQLCWLCPIHLQLWCCCPLRLCCWCLPRRCLCCCSSRDCRCCCRPSSSCRRPCPNCLRHCQPIRLRWSDLPSGCSPSRRCCPSSSCLIRCCPSRRCCPSCDLCPRTSRCPQLRSSYLQLRPSFGLQLRRCPIRLCWIPIRCPSRRRQVGISLAALLHHPGVPCKY